MTRQSDGDDAHLVDDGAPEVIAVEEAAQGHHQALWVRVGPVYDETKRDEPGVWICYQPEYMASSLEGPVLLSPEVWYQLVRAVDRRLLQQVSFRRRVWKKLKGQ